MKKRLLFVLLLLFSVVLVACKDDVKYTVTFNSNGGTNVGSVEVLEGELATRPTDPTRDDFIFEGWFKDQALTNEWKWTEDTVDADVTLFAKWREDTSGQVEEKVKVTFDFNYSGSAAPSVVEIDKGAKVTNAPALPTRVDFEFVGWSTSRSELVAFDLEAAVNADVTVYAFWESTLEEVTITFKVEGKEDVSEVIIKGEKIDALDVPTPTKDGYVFIGWFDTENKEWNFSNDVIEADLVVTAKFEELVRDGTPITTTDELVTLITGAYTDPDAVFYLTKDIDMVGVEIEYDNGAKFSGTLDGQGFTILNLTYHSEATNAKMGLFKVISDATIINLNIDKADIKSTNERAGIIAGEVEGGNNVVDNVHITNSKVYGNQSNNSAGGLFGYVKAATDINNVSLTGVEVEGGTQAVGGLIARINVSVELNITNVLFEGRLKGRNRVGGLIGDTSNINQTLIENILVIADITVETEHASGLIGKGAGNNNATDELPGVVVKNVATITKITGPSKNIGYISGDNNKFTTTDVYTYFEGPAITHGTAGTNVVLTNIFDIFDEGFWTTNLKGITESDLWEKTTSGIYVLKASNAVISLPTHLLVEIDFNYEDKVEKYSVSSGDLLNIEDPTRSTHNFTGWVVGDEEFDFSTPITSALTIKAIWEEKEFTNVTFKVEESDDVVLENVEVGTKLTQPTDPEIQNKRFIAWVDQENNEWDFNNDVVIDGLILTAKFESAVFGTVTYYVDDIVHDTQDDIQLGTTLTPPTNPEKVDHLFLGWYDAEDVRWDFENLLEVEDLKLYASFQKIEGGYVPEGTPISTASELYDVINSENSGNKFYLLNDIDLSEVDSWLPSATFKGTLDGNFKTLSNLDQQEAVYGGFIYRIGGATLKNITFDNFKITNYSNKRGGVIAGNTNGANNIIDNIKVINSLVDGSEYGSIIIGRIGHETTISNITILDSSIKAKYAGFITGYIEATTTISDIYIDATTTATERIGGIAGRIKANDSDINILIERVVANIDVVTDKDYGGIYGDLSSNLTAKQNIAIKNVLVTGDVQSQGNRVGSIGGTNRHLFENELAFETTNTFEYNFTSNRDGGLFAETKVDELTEAWWSENLASITTSNLWEFDSTLNVYKLK